MDKNLNLKPLTIEELCKMGGQPVYIADFNEWAIVSVEPHRPNRIRQLPPDIYLKGDGFSYDAYARGLTVYKAPINEEFYKTVQQSKLNNE